MKTIYVSDNGKQFNNKEECEKYENNLQDKNFYKAYTGLDSSGNKIDYYDPNFISKAKVVCIPTENARIKFLDRNITESSRYCTTVDDIGVYYWNEYDDNNPYIKNSWIYMDSIIYYQQQQINKLKN